MALIEIVEDTRTLEQKKDDLRNALKSMLTSNYTNTLNLYNKGNKMIWDGKAGLTPQECFDALGTDAASYVMLGMKVAELLNTAVPGTIDVSGMPAITINEDGTVTVL